MGKELGLEEDLKAKRYLDSFRTPPKKSIKQKKQTNKQKTRQAMMVYMDTGLKNSLPSMTDMQNPESARENETLKILWDFEIQTDHLIPANKKKKKKKKWKEKKKKKKNLPNCGVLADYRIKLKESEKSLLENWKKRNMKGDGDTNCNWALSTVVKWLVQGLEDLEIRGSVETIHTAALLRSARILRRVLEIWGDVISLRHQWKTIS